MWGNFIKIPKEIKESEMIEMIKAAQKELSKLEQDEHEKWLAEQRLIYIRDKHDTELYGYNRGIRKGKKEGMREGKEQGIREGKQEAIRELVINMYKLKMDNEMIQKLSSLSKEEIDKIIEEYKLNNSNMYFQ